MLDVQIDLLLYKNYMVSSDFTLNNNSTVVYELTLRNKSLFDTHIIPHLLKKFSAIC